MSEFPYRSEIKVGMRVFVELKQEQGSGKLTEGIIKDILTPSECHPYGIMVELKNGDRGRVKTAYQKNSHDLSKNISKSKKDVSIPKTEDTWNEFKSTFQYDLKEELFRKNGKSKEADIRKNNYKQIRGEIQKEIALTITAFANKDGGRLFIGVNDDSSILGLGRDLKLFNDSLDKFTLSVIDLLKNFLKNNAFIANLDFQFAEYENKKYLVINTPKSNEPIFINTNNGQETYVRMQTNSEKFTHEDFLKYCKERFPEWLR